MNPVFTFVLGLLIGWLIDYFYWRRRHSEKETQYVETPVQLQVDRNPAPVVQAPQMI